MMRLKIEIPQGYAFVAGASGMKKVLRRAGAEVAARARALIRQGASKGRVSTPGQPPVSRTGVLASSIKVKPWQDGQGVSIRDTAFYSLFLQQGAQGGGNPGTRMPINPKTGKRKRAKGVMTKRVLLPHPFMTVALEQVEQSNLGQRIVDAVVGDLDFKKAKR